MAKLGKKNVLVMIIAVAVAGMNNYSNEDELNNLGDSAEMQLQGDLGRSKFLGPDPENEQAQSDNEVSNEEKKPGHWDGHKRKSNEEKKPGHWDRHKRKYKAAAAVVGIAGIVGGVSAFARSRKEASTKKKGNFLNKVTFGLGGTEYVTSEAVDKQMNDLGIPSLHQKLVSARDDADAMATAVASVGAGSSFVPGGGACAAVTVSNNKGCSASIDELRTKVDQIPQQCQSLTSASLIAGSQMQIQALAQSSLGGLGAGSSFMSSSSVFGTSDAQTERLAAQKIPITTFDAANPGSQVCQSVLTGFSQKVTACVGDLDPEGSGSGGKFCKQIKELSDWLKDQKCDKNQSTESFCGNTTAYDYNELCSTTGDLTKMKKQAASLSSSLTQSYSTCQTQSQQVLQAAQVQVFDQLSGRASSITAALVGIAAILAAVLLF